MALRSLVVDFNSYFASVEQQVDPTLRGYPVGIVPMMADTTCCIAASYEAKKFGVKTGTRVGDAKKMCPGIRLIEARHEIYVQFHHALVAAVESCIHVDDVWSIDEMVCTLPANWRDPAKAEEIALKIKEAISRDAGKCLRCSIGIAPNPFLAKTASDMQKPDGLVLLDLDDLPHKLHRLELRDLCGVGEQMEARLHRHGIHTVEQLCAADIHKLRLAWGGVEGERMYGKLRGHQVYEPPTRHATVGHSHVLPPAERNEEAAFGVIHRLTQKAAVRLRKMGCYAGALHISIKYPDQTRWASDMRFADSQDTLHFIRVLGELWERRPHGKNPLAVGVTLLNLREAQLITPSLFEREQNHNKLSHLMDEINQKYGKNSVFLGGSFENLRSAPMRIAFTHIPDLETEADD